MDTRMGAADRAQTTGRGFLRQRRRSPTRSEPSDEGAPDRPRVPLMLRTYRTGVSVFVGAVLAAQAAVLLPAFDTGWGGPKTWPILSYHMYSRSRAEGDVVEARHLVEVTLAEGRTIELTPRTLGLNLWDFRHLTDRLVADDPDAVHLLKERYGAGAVEFAEIRINSFPVIVTRTGPRDSEPELVKRLALDARRPGGTPAPVPTHATETSQ